MSGSEPPKGWVRARLQDLCAEGGEAIVGGPFGSDLTSSDYQADGGVPVIRGSNLGGSTGEFLDDGFVFVSEAKAESLRRNSAGPGDIIFTQRGTLGQVAIIPGSSRFSRYIISQSQMRMTADENRVDPRFLFHSFRTPKLLAQISARALTTGVPHINLGILRDFPVELPPLPEQRRIAEVLDRAEALRAKRRAALAQLDTLTQSIFLDMFGDPATNPKGWPMKAMTHLFASSPIFGTMIPPVTQRCAWLSLRVGNIQNWTLDLRDSKYVELPHGSIERHRVEDGDLLLARAIASRDHLGKCVIAHPNDDQWTFDSHLMRLRFDREHAEPEFIRHYFMTPGGRTQFLKVSRKSTVQFNVNTKEISALRVPVPPIGVQRGFARRVVAVEKLRTLHRASIAELDGLFATLQHRAFRGEQ